MALRLVDRFPVGTPVEITFGDDDWLPAIVIAHAHPGVWVQTGDSRSWFVTHRDRMRLVPGPPTTSGDQSRGGVA